jgi:serine/threonine protein kinase
MSRVYQMKHNYPGGKVPFALSLAVGYAMIKHLKILHRRSRIVHGDIHLDNIMLESINWTNGSVYLQLIDFGRAFPIIPRPAARVRETGWSTHFLFSQWEIDGFAAAARDDIARAVQGIAQLMHPWSYMLLQNRISGGTVRESLEHKKKTPWFISPEVPDVELYDVIGSLNITMEYKDSIKTELEKVHDFVRGMDHDVNCVPPYGEIMQCLGNANGLYTRGRRSLMAS